MTTKPDGLWPFFALTMVLMAATFGVMAVFQVPGPSLDPEAETTAAGFILFFIGGFTPSIAGFIMAWRIDGRDGVRDLWRRFLDFGLGARWYLAIIAITLVAQLMQVVLALVAGNGLISPWYLEMPGAVLFNLPFILLLGPISEEFGWRGFAQDRVLARWGAPAAHLVLGAFWALWHLPLFWVPGTSQQALGNPAVSFPLFTVQILALTVIYAWVYVNTRRSIWGAVFIHFMTAFAPFLVLALLPDGGSFIHPLSLGAYAVVALGILATQRVQQPAPERA